MNRLPHVFDDEGVCQFCRFDGAEHHWLQKRLRIEIGNDEFAYRRESGEFDYGTYCEERPAENQNGVPA